MTMGEKQFEKYSEDIPVGVHKDFHLITASMIDYINKNYGPDETLDYLRRLATTVYGPLVEKIKTEGLPAIREHLTWVFDTDGGECAWEQADDALMLRVTRCPSIAQIKDKYDPIPRNFCEQTRTVLGEICRLAGVAFAVTFDTDKGTCVQTFSARKEGAK